MQLYVSVLHVDFLRKRVVLQPFPEAKKLLFDRLGTDAWMKGGEPPLLFSLLGDERGSF